MPAMTRSVRALGAAAGALIALLLMSACGDAPVTTDATDATQTPVPTPAQGDRKNVVLITLDTVRADHLGSYGHPKNITPNLDALAGTGVQFDKAISAASVTPVSHASILTGLIPPAHGLRVLSAEGSFRMDEDVETLANLLQSAGYRTGAVHSSFTVSGYFGFDRGFDFFDSFETDLHGQGKFRDWGLKQNQRRADATTGAAIQFLDAGEDPFFLWVHYWDMHDPMLLPDSEFMPPEDELAYNRRGAIQPNAALYAAEIRYMDHHFGRLMSALEERGHWEDTLIVIVADHGEGLGDHGWAFHRLLYQEQIRVPLIFWSRDIKGGVRSDRLVRTVDVMPTILDYVGVEIPTGLQGRSLRPLIEGRPDEERIAYADQINLFDRNAKMIQRRPKDSLLYSMQDQRWKLIYRPMHPMRSELFDLQDDPGEEKNLFAVDQPEAIRLLTQLATLAPWVEQAPTGSGMDPAARAQLEALGYVEKDEEQDAEPIVWSFVPADALGGRRYASADACARASQHACVPLRSGS
jgi:arylsulfatase A-like enzyme